MTDDRRQYHRESKRRDHYRKTRRQGLRRLAAYVPKDVHERLRQVAELDDATLSETVTRLLSQSLQRLP